MRPSDKGKGRQKRARSPEAGQSSRRRPAPSVPQDLQLAQVTQGFGNLGLTTPSRSEVQYSNYQQPLTTASRSEVQYSSYQQPLTSTYGHAAQTLPGQLSADDDRKLRIAVASGGTYQEIKNIMFVDRFDLSPQILEARAREISAEWTPGEDFALLSSLNPPFETTDDVVVPIRQDLQASGLISRLRLTDEVRERIICLMNLGEDYNLRNPPPGGSSQVQGQQVHGSQAYMPGEPTSDPDHQAIVPSSSRSWPTSQGFAYPSPLAPQPVLGNASAGQEAGGDPVQVGTQFGRAMTDEEFKLIKIEKAQGLTTQMIAAKRQHRTAFGIDKALQRRGYKIWPPEQDKHLHELHEKYGDDWVSIMRDLSGPERDEKEAQGRLEFLTGPSNVGIRRAQARGRFSPADDDYIRLRAAQGMSWADIAKERFPHEDRKSLGAHARMIGAAWSQWDDQALRERFLEYENAPEVDWFAIGQLYDPPRNAVVVENRWKRLRGLL